MNENKSGKKSTLIVVICLALLVVGLIVFLVVKNSSKGSTSEETEEVAEESVNEDDYVTEDETDPDDLLDEEQPDDNYEVVTEWPASELTAIPEFEAAEYSVMSEGGRIDIELNAEDASGLSDYGQKLKDAGAEVYYEDDYTGYYGIGDVEIQIYKFEESPRITICAEDTVKFDLDGFDEFLLPDSGRLVSIVSSEDVPSSCSLTYRNMSFDEAEKYISKLTEAGYTADTEVPESLSPFMVVLTKGNNKVTVDFHGAVSDVMIVFGKESSDSSSASDASEDENVTYLYDEETGHRYYLDEDGNKVIIYAEDDKILSDEEVSGQPVG